MTKIYLKFRLRLTPFEKVAEYVPTEGKIYDLGCGYGIFSNIMSLHSPKREVIGIDLSSFRIQVAQKSVKGRKNIKFVCTNLKDIVLEKCGTIVIYDVLHHINYQDQENLIKECFGKLGEKGLLIIKDNDTTPSWKFFWNYLHELLTRFLGITQSDDLSFRTKDGFLKLLFKSGFVVEAVNIPTKLPYPFILYLCRKVSKEKKGAGVVLINPPLTLEQRYGNLAKGGRNAPPLGLCSLAAVVRKEGYRVYLIDACALGLSAAEVVKTVISLSPKYVGITASTLAIESAGLLASKLKKQKPDLITILGGSHLSALPEVTLKHYSVFDFGIAGEGEDSLLELVSVLEVKKNLNMVKGIVFKNGKKIVVTAKRPFIDKLDRLPFPAWDLLPSLPRYYGSSPQSFNRLPSSSLVTSRGCPNSCTFCDRSVFGNRVRVHSPEYVLQMVKILCLQYGIKHILFDDDTMTVQKIRLKKICRLFIKEKLDLTWTCLARVDSVDREVLKLMKLAGCWQILFGIESGDQMILDKLKKGITLDKARKALALTQKSGIKTKGFFILGTPHETRITAQKTLDFIKSAPLDDFHMTFFAPFPGTEIYRNIDNKDKYKELWNNMNEWQPVYLPADMKSEELIRLSQKAFRQFYFRPKIIIAYIKEAFLTKNFTPIVYGASALIKFLYLKK